MSPARSSRPRVAITYSEWSAAKDNSLSMAQVDNGAGPVELTGESAGKAVAAAKQVGRATTSSSRSTTPPSRPGPTRSSW